MSEHVVTITSTPDGYLPICDYCGGRPDESSGYGTADDWAQEHEKRGRERRLNTGPRGASPRTLERYYRERADLDVYTPEEKVQWLTLADELADRLRSKTDVIDGQMGLFDEGETA